jgi:hypothetical protein
MIRRTQRGNSPAFRLALRVAACAIIFGAPAAAQDEPETTSLQYSAPAQCPQEAPFVRRVNDKTPLFRVVPSGQARRRFRVSVEGVAPSTGRLTIAGGGDPLAERVMQGESCQEVVEALALAVALAVDPKAADPRPEPTAESNAAPVASAPVAAVPRPAPPPVPTEPRRLERPTQQTAHAAPMGYGLGASVVGAAWATPNPLVGPAVTAELLNAPAGVLAALRLGVEQGWSKTMQANGWPVGFERTLARVEACPVAWTAGGIQVMPCGQASGGIVQATSEQIPRATHVVRPWISVGADALVRVGLGGHVSADMRVGVDFALARDRFIFQPDVLIYQAPWASGFAAVGLFYQLR